ncbi:LPS export ABC transporter periplasmic protein LptC [Paraglaciecola aquimarina]|uniref:Lipopolysaccharide export system protein LptC n=1 Tax=Paraglaciecola aquimarina TaxID=1235557 RepID=A0ABU3SS52_9ALTE|nr:LPS export ABC transporter periplasmic protein LptC [Paraglaciecola aquimarina]MDU0352829.1 LPS export ABC transporter periplasmic protein LptC [Paraglaciecola aquimarina]
MNRTTICIALLFILALSLSLPGWLKKEQDLPVTQTEEAWIPNYQAKKMRSTLYDKTGNINHQVFAEYMENYDLLGFTLFKRPEYLLYSQTRHPWQVNAQEGTLYEDQRLQFETDVEIKSLNDDGYMQIIRTQFVEINLIDKTMTSDQAVEIVGPNYVINSNGFTVSLETQRYELLDHVKTVYQPSPQN